MIASAHPYTEKTHSISFCAVSSDVCDLIGTATGQEEKDSTEALGWEFSTGRFTQHSDRSKELKERNKSTRHLSTVQLRVGNFCLPLEGTFGYLEEDKRFYSMLREEQDTIMGTFMDTRACENSLYEHVVARQEWLASGSAKHSALRVDGKVLRGNKRTVFEAREALAICNELRQAAPAEHGTGSETHENDFS